MISTLNRLVKITHDCRDDMHEPDEQGIKARVVGSWLDNACGESISAEALTWGYQEIVIILERDNITETFNLADIIALARKAKL